MAVTTATLSDGLRQLLFKVVDNTFELAGGAMTDADAIHDNVAGEIAAIADKTTPIGGDHIIIEDSAAGNIKKDVLLSALPISTAAQAALDAKAPKDSPTFTGTVVVPDDSFVLGIKTSGNYVASIATTAPLSGGAAGSEGTALTLTTSMATDKLLGRDTAGTGVAEELSVAGGLEFTGSGGIQRSALTGDATASAGSNAITVVTAPLPRSYLAGLGIANNVSDATNDIDIAVGTCRDSTNAQNLVLSSALTKRLDAVWAVGTNQGGLDTGSIANTTYHVWLIKRSDTGVIDALFSTSATAPTMPANYDYKRRISSIIRESASIIGFTQNGNNFRRKAASVFDVSSTNPGTSAVTVALSVPIGIVVIADLFAQITPGTSGIIHVLLLALDETDRAPSSSDRNLFAASLTSDRGSSQVLVKTDTSAQVRFRFSASGASDSINIYTFGWIDTRGRDD